MNPDSTTEDTSPSLEQQVAQLQLSLEAAEAEIKVVKDKYLRTYADFENFRRRTAADLEDARRNGELKVMRALLSTLDDLERALGFAQADPSSIVGGVQTVVENFRRSLRSLGAEAVPGAGSEFDPRHHEAIGMVEGEDGKVMHVYQEGFRVGEALVRPARVVVGSAPKEQSPN